jgi:hypothetical protein
MTDRRQRQPASDDAACDPKGRGRSGSAATASDAYTSRLGTEKPPAPVGSWALRSIESVHPQLPAAKDWLLEVADKAEQAGTLDELLARI